MENLRLGARLGSLVHNTQIIMDHADGSLVSDEQVSEIYLKAYEIGEESGCRPTFEVHVNMWSEDFRRISEVADQVESKGVPYHMIGLFFLTRPITTWRSLKENANSINRNIRPIMAFSVRPGSDLQR